MLKPTFWFRNIDTKLEWEVTEPEASNLRLMPQHFVEFTPSEATPQSSVVAETPSKDNDDANGNTPVDDGHTHENPKPRRRSTVTRQ